MCQDKTLINGFSGSGPLAFPMVYRSLIPCIQTLHASHIQSDFCFNDQTHTEQYEHFIGSSFRETEPQRRNFGLCSMMWKRLKGVTTSSLVESETFWYTTCSSKIIPWMSTSSCLELSAYRKLSIKKKNTTVAIECSNKVWRQRPWAVMYTHNTAASRRKVFKFSIIVREPKSL